MRLICAMGIVAALSPGLLAGRAVADTRDELFAQFASGVRQLEALGSPMTVSGRIVSTRRADPRSKPKVEEFEYLAANGYRLVTLRRLTSDARPSPASEQVICIGPGVAFRLHRDASGPYRVLEVSPNPNLTDVFNMKAGRYVASPYSILGTPLSAILDRPDFVLLDASEVVQEGRRLVRISYSPNRGRKADKVHLIVDPSLGWAIRSGRIEVAGKAADTIRFENRFAEGAAGSHGLPSEVEVDSNTESIETMSVGAVRRQEIPVERFAMTHYGLPDLARPEPGRAPILAWMLGGAALLLVQSLVLRAGVKRRMPAGV